MLPIKYIKIICLFRKKIINIISKNKKNLKNIVIRDIFVQDKKEKLIKSQ